MICDRKIENRNDSFGEFQFFVYSVHLVFSDDIVNINSELVHIQSTVNLL